jgi:5-methylcytosine-specific restriction endonuclease McrA
MPWANTPEDRRRSSETYGDPVYLSNRDEARRRARGFCEECGHRHSRLECDHVIPRSQGGTHDLSNLRMTCKGPGSCKCHERKSAAEGHAARRAVPAQPPDPLPRPVTRW